MIDNRDVGYYEELINGSSIVRARTIRQIRSWEFPRSLESLQTLNNEFAGADYRTLIEELNFFLNRKNLIGKFIEKRNEEEVLSDELKKILTKNGFVIQKWGAYESEINNSRFFIRSGSKKHRGWQVTFRDRFKEALQKSDGYLLMPMGGIVIIPFSVIKTVFDDSESVFKNNTIDVFIEFTEDNKARLNYKRNSLDITEYKLFEL